MNNKQKEKQEKTEGIKRGRDSERSLSFQAYVINTEDDDMNSY